MPRQRIQDQWSGSREHGTLIPECKKRPYPSSLSPLTSNFDCEPNQGLKDVRIIFRYLTENALKHPSTPCFVKTATVAQMHSALDESHTNEDAGFLPANPGALHADLHSYLPRTLPRFLAGTRHTVQFLHFA